MLGPYRSSRGKRTESCCREHCGPQGYARAALEDLPLLENSNDFVFDNQMLAQILHREFSIGEISCPAAYFEEASSINFSRSVRYGLGVLATSFQLFAHRRKWKSFPIFEPNGRKLETGPTP